MLNDKLHRLDLKFRKIENIIRAGCEILQDCIFFELDLSTKKICDLSMQTKSNFSRKNSYFEQYHENYSLCIKIPCHSSQWSLVSGCEIDGLPDRFHRFHNYYQDKIETITLGQLKI